MKMVIRRKKRFRYKREVIAGLVIIAAALLFVLGFFIWKKQPLPVVTITVSDAEMREEGTIPEFQVTATCDENESKVMLDRKAKYTLDDFVKDINNGMGYIIELDTDGAQEGTYVLSVNLNDELKEKFEDKWYKKFEIRFVKGELLVKNKYGDWDGTSFVLLDGSYVKGWFNVGTDTYYFDEDNNYLVGEHKIDGRIYYFGEDGRFDAEKNNYNPTKPVVALTFDDGPGNYTMELLEFLEEHNAKATFFMLGTRVSKYPDEVKKMVEIGCELGNHSATHLQLTKGSNSDIAYEIGFTDDELETVVGEESSCVRPPYGSYDDRVKYIAGKPIIMWSLDTLDWEYRNVKKIKKEIRKSIKDGDIVLMHDIYDTTVQAIKEMIVELEEEDYQFVTVSELAEIRNVEMEDGEVYNNFYKK